MTEHNRQIGDGDVPDRYKDRPQPLKDMHLSEDGERLIKHFESCRLQAYPDSGGLYTIGWGTTRYENGREVKKGDTITQGRADALFKLQIPKYEQTVKGKIKRNLLQHEFDALVSFVYNAGTSYNSGGFWKDFNIFSNVNKGVTGEEMINYWSTLAITAKGKKLNGLIRRRKAEAHLFVFGVLILE